MNKYRVHASYSTYLYLDVEANSLDEAWQIAKNADGGDFKSTELGDWNIDFVREDGK